MDGSDDPARLALVDALFDAALDLTEAERSAFLAERCAGDDALRVEVEELLRLSTAPAPAIDDGVGVGHDLLAELTAPEAFDPPLAAGARVGAWRLLKSIGAGGMGAVYLAERADGEFVQQAAVKILRASLETPHAIERFERERQILAGLEHPHIARLIDGGHTGDGRPYLVLEYVDGMPIDRYCDEHRLDIAARLALFQRVGEAVQYAHQNLVVHRDLKPANIVVTADGTVKLLDFGIAKTLTVQADLTQTLARVMTPEYGSPEQLHGQPVTAASDVYQLGLLLYELLTGRRAHQFENTSPAAIERGICERIPERPSAAVLASEGWVPRPDAPALARVLRGDLDTIVLKTLRKEPERRYPSVASLLADLERYRQGRPIQARPDTFGYRTGKFLGRHRLAVATTAVGALLVVALTLWYTANLRAERDRVQVEAEKSRAALEFVLGTFSALDPVVGPGPSDMTAAELLARGVTAARRDLADQPEVRAALLDAFGRIYLNLALYDQGEDALVEALEIRRRLLPPGHRDIGLSAVHLAMALDEKGDLERAGDLGAEGLEILRQQDPVGLDLGRALKTLASIRGSQGRFEESKALYEEAVAQLEAAGEDGALQLLWAQHSQATLFFDLGDYGAAADLYRRTAEDSERYALDSGTPLPWSMGGEGAALSTLGRLEEGEALLRRALALMRERFPDVHPEFAQYERLLATNLTRQERLAEAETHYRSALDIFGGAYGPRHPEVAKTLFDLAGLERRMERFDAARRSIADCLDILDDFLPPTHPHLGRATAGSAWIELEGGAPREARARFDRALEILGESMAEDHPLVLDARSGRAASLRALGDEPAACAEWRQIAAIDGGEQLQDAARVQLRDFLATCG